MKESDVLDRLPKALKGCLANVPRSSVDRITSGVLHWLVAEKRYTIGSHWLEISEATMKFNAALDARWTDVETQDRLRALSAY